MDVTCDNLLDAVKQTVEEETARLRLRWEAELAVSLREAIFEEQQLGAKAGRFECELKWSPTMVKHRRISPSVKSKQNEVSRLETCG